MELKPCPFCGKLPDTVRAVHGCTTAYCDNILCPIYLKPMSVDQWNTRPGECAEPTPTHEEPHT